MNRFSQIQPIGIPMLRPSLVAMMAIFACSHLSAAQFRYQGQLEQLSREGAGVAIKEFQVRVFLNSVASPTAFYHLEEGRPALPWIERFGEITANETILSVSGVAIGYRHLDRNYVLPVGLPYFPDHDKLSAGAGWQSKEGQYEVSGDVQVNGQSCWEVKCTIGIARHHVFHVRKSSPIIEAATQTVFMGPGDRFRIKFQRLPEETNPADTQEFERARQVLLEMKSSVERSEFNRFQPLSPEQVQVIAESRAKLLEVTGNTVLAALGKEIDQELTVLLNRQDRVANLAGSMLNQEIPKFTLLRMDLSELPSSSFTGKTVLLHFWDYANPSLEQPYGQVGYLDFLDNRWKEKGVVVYGVAVNSQLTDPETRSQAIRNIQKLKQFMKLGYEITLDGGAVLNSFGNPTRLGEELPLWIVISPDGRVSHYHTGYYEVDNRVGLKVIHDTLESIIQK